MKKASRLALAAVCVGGSVTFASTASAGVINLSGPENGAQIAPGPGPHQVALTWNAAWPECVGPRGARGQLNLQRSDGTMLPPQVSSWGRLEGGATLSVTAMRPARYTWWVTAACYAGGEMTSEQRTFTVLPNQPRIQGRYRVTVHGTPQIWTFRPRCSAGACNTVMTRPGQRGGAMLRWDASRRRYVGRFTLQSPARERVCIITRRRNGLVVSRRTHRNVYAASQGTIVLSPRTLVTVSNRTVAGLLVGRQTARYVPTARGRALGCPMGRRASAQLVAQRR